MAKKQAKRKAAGQKKSRDKKAVKKAAPSKGGLMKATSARVKKPAGKKASVKETSVKKASVKKAEPSLLMAGLQAGDLAPGFKVQSDSGEWVSLQEFKGKTVVLYFYPKDDTPGCTKESCDFRDSFTRLTKDGVVVLGASKDSVNSHQKFKTKYQLPFPLLSDEAGTLCESYGVWKEKSMYGRKYMGIERSTFLIDASGRIAKVYPKVSVPGHVEQVLSDLEELKGK